MERGRSQLFRPDFLGKASKKMEMQEALAKFTMQASCKIDVKNKLLHFYSKVRQQNSVSPQAISAMQQKGRLLVTIVGGSWVMAYFSIRRFCFVSSNSFHQLSPMHR